MFSCPLCVRPRPRHRVDLHVVPEVARSGEGSRTLLAGVRLVLDVGHAVVVQVGGGREALPTHLAHVRLLSSVDPAVRVQAGAGAEPLVAEVALVGPLPCMGADVSLQETGTVELFATRVAGEQSLSGAVAGGARPAGNLVPPRVPGQGEGEGVQGEGG